MEKEKYLYQEEYTDRFSSPLIKEIIPPKVGKTFSNRENPGYPTVFISYVKGTNFSVI